MGRPEGGSAARSRPRPRLAWLSSRWAIAAAIHAFAFAMFFGSWKDTASMSGDPIRYAQIGREIVERGDPSRLTLDGRLAPNKPPLVYWLEAISFKAFGFSEWAARLPSAVMGVATVALLVGLVSSRRGRRTAFWAGVACLAIPVFQRTAHQARIETTLAFFTLASIGAFLRMDRKGFSGPRALAVGALAGLAVLTKGPAGVLGLGAIVLGALLARRGRLVLRAAPWAAAALLVVGGSWYALQLSREGADWWSALHADWTRETAPVQTVPQAIAFYTTDVLLPALPWFLAFGFGVALTLRRRRRDAPRTLPETVSIGLVAALLLSLPALSMHYGRYFAQVAPAIAWVGATWLAPAVRRLTARLGGIRLERVLVLVLLAGAFVAYPIYVARDEPSPSKYPDLEATAAEVNHASPTDRVVPTTSPAIERGEKDSISLVTLAAARFYYDLHLSPLGEGTPSSSPFVLFLHSKDGEGPDAARAFEAAHRVEVVRRSPTATLYRVR